MVPQFLLHYQNFFVFPDDTNGAQPKWKSEETQKGFSQ